MGYQARNKRCLQATVNAWVTQRTIDIDAVSLVIQNGPESAWNWTTVGTIRLYVTALA